MSQLVHLAGEDGDGDWDRDRNGNGPGDELAPTGVVQPATRTRKKTHRPRRYKVVLHNDDYTSMDFVVEILRRFFGKSPAEAVHLMLNVHHKGRATAGVYPREVAETKVAEATAEARSQGMPLLLTTEVE